MKCEFINAVIHALKETLINLSPEFDKIEIKKVFIRDEMFTKYPVVVKVGFSGGLRGMVAMSMELQTAINLADLLLVTDGTYAAGFTDIVQSSLKEVSNMFAGMVAMFLSKDRPEIDIAAPQLSFGTRLKVTTRFCSIPLCMVLEIPGGPLEFDVSLAEAASKNKA